MSDFLAQNIVIPLDQNGSKGAKCPKDLRINVSGKKEWDQCVRVVFQAKAWCDENIMKSWVSEDWDNHFLNPATPGFTGKILFADIHRAPETSSVKQLLHKNKIFLINIAGGARSRVQPLDVVVNKPFKNYARKFFKKT